MQIESMAQLKPLFQNLNLSKPDLSSRKQEPMTGHSMEVTLMDYNIDIGSKISPNWFC
jgi:hypothetical protein